MEKSPMKNFKSSLVSILVILCFSFVTFAALPVEAKTRHGKAGISASAQHKKAVKKGKKAKKGKKSKKSKKAKVKKGKKAKAQKFTKAKVQKAKKAKTHKAKKVKSARHSSSKSSRPLLQEDPSAQ